VLVCPLELHVLLQEGLVLVQNEQLARYLVRLTHVEQAVLTAFPQLGAQECREFTITYKITAGFAPVVEGEEVAVVAPASQATAPHLQTAPLEGGQLEHIHRQVPVAPALLRVVYQIQSAFLPATGEKPHLAVKNGNPETVASAAKV
jgi:hypothetical protein